MGHPALQHSGPAVAVIVLHVLGCVIVGTATVLGLKVVVAFLLVVFVLVGVVEIGGGKVNEDTPQLSALVVYTVLQAA